MKTIVLKTTAPFKFLTNPIRKSPAPSRLCLLLVPLLTVCLWAPPQIQAVVPPPDGCYPGFTTAEGCSALDSLTTGIANTAVGWFSLNSNTDGSFNTAVGAGALDLNNGNENTAVGTGALLLNTTGANNTAVGAFALINNTDDGNTAIGDRALQDNTGGGANTATGFHALIANTIGLNNAAYGVRPLENNVDGSNNTAIGNLALVSSVSTSDHVCVGRHAGDGITTANNNVIIGHHSGVHSVFGEVSDRCFIDNIFGAPVSAATGTAVLVDSDGRLGTFTVDGPDQGGLSPQRVQPQAVPNDAKQTKLNLKVERLQLTVARQQKQIETLITKLEEQAAHIQKVSAQLEVSKPATKVVVNEP